MADWIYPLLRCPVCRHGLAFRRLDDAGEQGLLEHDHGDCVERYPVIDGIARMLVGPERAAVVAAHREWFARHGLAWPASGTTDAVVAGFDDEWRRFSRVGTEDQSRVYQMYFDLVPDERFGAEQIVLDAGCGAGRWAAAVAARGPRVVAIDLGRSVEIARANTPHDRVACVQADVETLPLADGSVNWAYSLGVLHHTESAPRALAKIVAAVKPGGLVLLYLYYAFDQRGAAFRATFAAVDAMRRVLSRSPRAITRAAAAAIAALVYWPLARASSLIDRAGAHDLAAVMPLSFYRDLSFATMRNDSLDRFGTRRELRYTKAQMSELMRGAGLTSPAISEAAPYWHGIGVKT